MPIFAGTSEQILMAASKPGGLQLAIVTGRSVVIKPRHFAGPRLAPQAAVPAAHLLRCPQVPPPAGPGTFVSAPRYRRASRSPTPGSDTTTSPATSPSDRRDHARLRLVWDTSAQTQGGRAGRNCAEGDELRRLALVEFLIVVTGVGITQLPGGLDAFGRVCRGHGRE